jgi:hypothetical protein
MLVNVCRLFHDVLFTVKSVANWEEEVFTYRDILWSDWGHSRNASGYQFVLMTSRIRNKQQLLKLFRLSTLYKDKFRHGTVLVRVPPNDRMFHVTHCTLHSVRRHLSLKMLIL